MSVFNKLDEECILWSVGESAETQEMCSATKSSSSSWYPNLEDKRDKSTISQEQVSELLALISISLPGFIMLASWADWSIQSM